MQKIVLIYDAETNTVEQSLLLTDHNMAYIQPKEGVRALTIEVPTHSTLGTACAGEQASDEAIEALRRKLMPETAPSAEVTQVGPGKDLCHDEWTGRYLMSSMHEIERAVSVLNMTLREEGNADMNRFYDEIDLPFVPPASIMGWSGEDTIEARFGAVLSPEGRPAISFWLTPAPVPAQRWR